MSLLEKLFNLRLPSFSKASGEPKTSGELIAELTDGANLVEGKQTWELAYIAKDDLVAMQRCCDAELRTMRVGGLVPAPFYFERVAILLRKAKRFAEEVEVCDGYMAVVEDFYSRNGTTEFADVRKGPRYLAIQKRVAKAKELLRRQDQ